MDTLTPSAATATDSTSEPSAAVGLASARSTEDWFRPCALILVEEESPHLAAIVKALVDDDLPCLLIDSRAGGSQASAQLLALTEDPAVQLLRQAASEGRGAALAYGLHEASRLGYSHAAQVDGNGRDDLQRVSLFLDRASQAPDAVICSHPRSDTRHSAFDSAVWRAMRLSRLSARVRAARCELRVYPLATTLAHAACPHLARAPHYDSELLMRMHEHKLPMVWLRTPPLAGHDGRSCTAKMGVLDVAGLLARALLGKR